MELIDNINKTLKEDFVQELHRGSKVSIAASCFSIYAFEELKRQLKDIDELRFIFTSPTFVTEKANKQKREFYIPRLDRERNLYGSEFEIKLRNELSQKAIAKECAEWIRRKACFKSNRTGEHMPGFATLDDKVYAPINGFTTVDLGCERGNNAYTMINKLEAPFSQSYLILFDQVWNDTNKMQVVTDKVLDNITNAYKENAPDFIYFVTIYNTFREFLDDLSEDTLPNEATGFKDSQIWNKLYNFQKDACLAIINKLEKYNGCILADIIPEHDSKLQQLIADLRHKFAHPINEGNKKVIIFTAFSDTAEYLYNCLAEPIKARHGLNTALVTGDVEARSTVRLPQREKLDFNKVLTLFSPVSKEKATIYPHITEEIDVLIATDCISEGQNLQDCDYLINYDIHWNPVRIIQRFGRIDRIGSRNQVIQLVNYWPNVTLDEYIDLKGRVEARMKVSVLTSTGDDNPISPEEKGDLEYRREQLKRLQSEVVDMEEMNTGISIMDLGLNEFRLDLLAYMKDHPDIEHTPFGLHAVVPAREDSPAGVVYVLKNRNNGVNIDHKNRLHPFYLIYIKHPLCHSEQSEESEYIHESNVYINHLQPKELLDKLRFLCKGKATPELEICRAFNEETHDGKDMSMYSELLGDAIASIIDVKEESDIDSFLSGVQGSLFGNEIKGLDDFELICFLVIK